MKAVATYFREKAELFRRLADALGDQHDQIVAQLHNVADEFDASADALDTRIAREAAHLSCDEETPQLH